MHKSLHLHKNECSPKDIDNDKWQYILCHMSTTIKKIKGISSVLNVLYMSDWAQIRRKSIQDNWIVVTTTNNSQERWIVTYANLIGQRKLLHEISTTNIQTIIDGLSRGLPTNAIDKVTDLIGINKGALSKILDVSPRTLSRRDTLKSSASERLLRVSALFQQTLEVIGERKEAQRWFTEPKKALGGKTPFELSETDVGAREVEDLLGRIEYGVYA